MFNQLSRAFCAPMLLAFSLALAASEGHAPDNVAGAKTITPAEAKALFEKEVIFIDVRGEQDFDAGRIPGAVHLSLNGTLTEASLAREISKTDEVVFYCNGVKCKLSSQACANALSWGFTKVYYFREGMPGWTQAGYPVE